MRWELFKKDLPIAMGSDELLTIEGAADTVARRMLLTGLWQQFWRWARRSLAASGR
jgi:hypothetical protein